jgi:hypothetical protein
MAKKVAKKKAASAKKASPAKKTATKSAAAKKAPAKKVAEKKAPPEKKAAVAKKKPVKRSRAAKEVRLKAFWGVFNQSLRRVALYEFNERKQADKKAAELTKSGKSPHFVQPVKEQIVEG